MGKSDKIPLAVRQAVWNTHIGVEHGISPCFMGCGTIISQAAFHCGHVIAKSKGGPTTIQNLRPICQRCNTSMGNIDMYDFCREYGFSKSKLTYKDHQQLLKQPKEEITIVEKQQCQANTIKGDRCSLSVQPGKKKYCHVHSKPPKHNKPKSLKDVIWSIFKLY